MAELVPQTKEPITVFLCRVRELYERRKVSTVIALGSCGEYFRVADTVICMDGYKPMDLTDKSKAVLKGESNPWLPPWDSSFTMKRFPHAPSFTPTGRNQKTVARRLQMVQYGDVDVDVGMVEQLVEVSQLRAILAAISYMLSSKLLSGELSLKEALDKLEAIVDRNGLQSLSPNRAGDLSLPRRLEIAAVMNRIPHARFKI